MPLQLFKGNRAVDEHVRRGATQCDGALIGGGGLCRQAKLPFHPCQVHMQGPMVRCGKACLAQCTGRAAQVALSGLDEA